MTIARKTLAILLLALGTALPAANGGACKQGQQNIARLQIRAAGERQMRQELSDLFNAVAIPVLDEGQRRKLAQVTIDVANQQVEIRYPGEVYYLKLTRDENAIYPQLTPPEVGINEKGEVTATLVIDPRSSLAEGNVRYTVGAFRSALRAGVLHPLHPAPGHTGPFIPTHPQRNALDSLVSMALAERLKNPGRPVKLGEMMPGGNGKTLVVAKYAKSIGDVLRKANEPGWKKKPKVLVLVNNIDLLDQMKPVFEREMGLTKFSPIYGEHLPASVDPKAQLHASTPVSFLTRKAEFEAMMKADPDQPWIIFLDEAQHTETPEGRFQEVREFIDAKLDHRHHVVAASAFFGYRDASLFRDFLGGNVHASNLEPDELAMLQRGENLAELAYVQYVRAVLDGYVPPLLKLEIATQTRFENLLGASYVDKEGRHAVIYQALLDDIAQRIRNNRDPNVVQRGILFVDLVRRADAYRDELLKPERLGKDTEIRSYHSGEEASPDATDWIADRGKYDTPEERRKHKIIVVVDSLNEGFDSPNINTVILARNYTNSYAGFGYLRQNQARSERVHAKDGQFKPGVVLIDYSERSLFLHQGLSKLVAVSPGKDGGKGRIRIARAKTVDLVVDPATFEARVHEFFNDLHRDFVFIQHTPFFKYEVFIAEALPELIRQARFLGVDDWSGEQKSARRFVLLLAERLPDKMPGKAALIERLKNDKYWGWQNGDGKNAFFKIAPARRIYRAVYDIAALYHTLPEGRNLNLESLNTVKGMSDFLNRLLPELRPLAQTEVASYIDPRLGALPAMLEMCGSLSDAAKSKQQLLFVLNRAADKLGKSAADLKSELKDMAKDWPDRDTHKILKNLSDQSRIHLVYREWRQLAFLWNREHPAQKVDPDKIHLRSELQRFYSLLNGWDWTDGLTAEQLKTFVDTRNTIFERSAEFKVNSIQLDFGMKKLAFAWVDAALKRYPADPKLVELRADMGVSDLFPWGKYETFGDMGVDRVHRIAYAISKVILEHEPGMPLQLDNLYTREGLDRFMDVLLFGYPMPSVTDEQLATLRTNGTTERLQQVAYGLGIASTDYFSEGALADAFRRLVAPAPDSAAKKLFLARLDEGWFRKLDGEQARDGRLPALRRLHRALYAARLVIDGGKPPAKLAQGVFTPDELEKLSDDSAHPPSASRR